MTLINSYLIEPLAPLVFRSGKPFGSQASASDVIFPLPSAAAGLIRATGISQNKLNMDEHQINDVQDQSYQKVLEVQTTGPYLARFDETKRHVEVLVPKPADALYFEEKSDGAQAQTRLIRLSPKELAEGCGSDLPKGLLPVQMHERIKGKPKSGVAYWTLEHFKLWQSGATEDRLNFDQLQQHGISQLPIEIRTHVAIDGKSQASENGKLFQTANLDLGYGKVDGNASLQSAQSVWQDKRLGFVVQTQQSLQADMVTFGGERRLSRLSALASLENFYDDDAETLLQKINHSKGFRLTFLTPCIFAQGYLPAWLDEDSKQGTLPNTKAGVRLRACAVDRWQPVSGWDSILWKPKAMRKAISSGSVYWFALDDELTLEDLQQIMTQVWSDDRQDKRDGFGIAIIAPWQAN